MAGQPSQNTSWSAPLSSTYRNSQGKRNNVALTLGIIGAVSFAIAGLQMIGITSEASSEWSGGTIFEVYYHAMGWFSFGMAFVSATLGCLGWKR